MKRPRLWPLAAAAALLLLVRAVSAGYEQWPMAPPSIAYVGDQKGAELTAMEVAVATLQMNFSDTPVVLRAAAISLMDACFAERARNVAACSDLGTLDSQGDGFVRLTSASLVAKGNAILQAPVNSTVPLDSSRDLEGAYVSMLDAVVALTGITIVYETPWLPLNLRLSQDRIAQMVYVFDILKYDIMLTSTVMAYERAPFTRFSVPVQPFGSIVLVQAATVPTQSLANRLFTWVAPFTGDAWVVLVGVTCLVGLLMATFEVGHSSDYEHIESDSAWHTKCLQFCEGIYLSFAVLTSCGGYAPMTLGGRVLYITYAFTVWLVLSCYIANLATLLVVSPSPYQPIQSVQDLSTGLFPTCVLDKSVFQRTLIQNYPGVKMVVLNSSSGNAAVAALASPTGPCRAVVAPNVLLQYAMGPADPDGQYCGLQFAGSTFDFGYYAIPFNRRVPRHVVEAIDTIILAQIDSGNATTALQADFPTTRPKCDQLAAELAFQAAEAAKEPPPLGLPDIAGIFLVLLIGICIAIAANMLRSEPGGGEANGAGAAKVAGKGKGDSAQIPVTFIGETVEPNMNVERIVAQAVDAIRSEVIASLGKITREQMTLQRSQTRGGAAGPGASGFLHQEGSEPATLLPDGRVSARFAPPAGMRQNSRARPPPAAGNGYGGRTDAGRPPARAESEGNIPNGRGGSPLPQQQGGFNLWGLPGFGGGGGVNGGGNNGNGRDQY